MKKKLYILCTLLMVLKVNTSAQVGINTKSPLGIFHIHPDVNKSSSDDDIVFTNEGRLGIGTTNPTAQLHIESTVVNPLQIIDGNQANNRVLISDESGYGNWGSMRGTGGEQFSLAAQTFQVSNKVLFKFSNGTSSYKATGSGNYLFFLRMWGTTSTANNFQVGFDLFLHRNGVEVDKVQFYAPCTTQVKIATFSVILAAPKTEIGDVFSFYMISKTGSYIVIQPGSHANSKITVFMM